MAANKEHPDVTLAKDIARFYDDPLGFVIYAWDWDNDPSLRLVKLQSPYDLIYGCEYGPDLWFCQFLDELGQQIRARGFDGTHAVDPIRFATASGHGIGKSAGVAMLVNFIMSTRPFCKGTITANTSGQLETKTWAEIAKWQKKCITSHWFDVSTGRGSMKMVSKQHPEAWACAAQTCREENSEAFAGQHAANSTSFYIFDEGSAVPDSIYSTSEGGLTDGEPMIFCFGNPTRNTGAFKGCFTGPQAKRWVTRQIDSRTCTITNKTQIQQWIDDYGLDSDFVKVRVRGMFPSMSAKQFISVADVDAAFGKHLRPEQYNFAPKILVCDPAWEGDDMLEIGLRQGLMFKLLRTIPKNDNDMEIASILGHLEDEHQADAVFVDAGYGTGIVSAGKQMKRDWQLVWFAGASADPGCLNKRAEMAKLTRDWLKSGGSIQDNHELYEDLIAPETIWRDDGKVQLESKKDIKARIGRSPGKGDLLFLSFAYPVAHKPKPGDIITLRAPSSSGDFDPYQSQSRARQSDTSTYNPYD